MLLKEIERDQARIRLKVIFQFNFSFESDFAHCEKNLDTRLEIKKNLQFIDLLPQVKIQGRGKLTYLGTRLLLKKT